MTCTQLTADIQGGLRRESPGAYRSLCLSVYSRSDHTAVTTASATVATAARILPATSRTLRANSVLYITHKSKSSGVRSGDRGGQLI
jgi:hypothetical protein